jgi:catalase
MGGLAERAVESIYGVYGRHDGFRAAHAKGTLLTGTFSASPEAAALTTAAHMQGGEIAATVRFSKGSGDPTWPDAERDVRGMAVKFHLPSGSATDILMSTLPTFFVRTPEDFIAFSRAVRPRRGNPRKANPLRVLRFVATHPESARATWGIFRTKAVPSFANSRFNSLHAYRWIDPDGRARHIRYSWLPEAGELNISVRDARRRGHDYLQQEIGERVVRDPVRFALEVQIAEEGDLVDDPTAAWPAARKALTVGALVLDGVTREEGEPIVFDPARVTDGIELSGDPVLRFRPLAYEVSADRRTRARQ